MEVTERESTATVDMLGPVVTDVVASTQSRNIVGKKLTPNSVNVHMEDSHADLLTSQYLHLHRVPDSLTKGLDSGVINGDLLAHHVVDLASQADFPQHNVNVSQQYYETDDLLSPDMTDEDKNLAAALVTVQLIQQQKHQQHHQNIDLLGTKTMAPLSAVPPVGMDKPAMAAMVSYIQAVEEEAAQQQLLEQQHSRILKMYQPSVPTQLQEMKLQPLPPLKKVLSSQSMGNHSKYVRHLPTQVVTNMAQMNNIELPQVLQAAPENRVVAEAMGGGGEDGGDTDYEAEGEMMRPQRRNLPHKKRIAKKLKAPTPTAVRNVHTKCYKCNKCGESFANQSAFSTHRTVHTAATAKRPAALPTVPPPVPPTTNTTVVTFYACEICGHQSSNQLRFFEHLKSHYEPSQLTGVGDTVEVVIVDPVAVTESTTTETDHLPLNQPCRPTISHAYTIKSESEHIVKEEEEEEDGVDGGVYKCQQCDKNFRRATAVASHMSVAHRTQVLGVQDEIEEFSEPEDMMEGLRHVVNIQGEDSGEEEPTDDKLRVWRYSEMQGLGMDLEGMVMLPHAGGTEGALDLGGDLKKRRGTRKGGGSRTLGCTQCDRTFNHRNSLLYHIRSHSGQRPYQCDVCGKSFFSASALKVHLRTHSGDKPYKCAYCGRHFRQWGDLKYHCVSLHSFKKQFQCEFCGKDFARKYSLIVHRRIHTGERNYRCEFCNKSFRASSYLQNHRRIHTGEKPHSCDICGKPFRVRSDMRRHRNTHARDRSSGGGTAPTESGSNRSNHRSSDEEEEPESILPDGSSTPLNLNVRQTDSDDGLAYTRDSLDRENSPLFVWIPTENQSLLPDE